MLASSAPQRPRLPWRVHLPDLDGKGLWRAAEATIITPSSLSPLPPPSPPTQRVTLRAPDVPGVSPLPHWAGPRSSQPAYWGGQGVSWHWGRGRAAVHTACGSASARASLSGRAEPEAGSAAAGVWRP